MRNQNDYICTVCEGTTGLHPCEGGCLRSFHAACVGLSGPPQKPWRCDNCTAERQPCFACGKFGRSAKARTADAANVRKCSVPACGKFYHLECVSKLPMTRLNKERFTCPVIELPSKHATKHHLTTPPHAPDALLCQVS